jgi:Domain of unknown function (DUF4266)
VTVKSPLSIALAAGLSLLTGCSNLGQVQPWEKGQLAKPSMTFEADPLDQRFMQHIYYSKDRAPPAASCSPR